MSSAGYAMGYVSGGVLLLINLAWILQPATFGFGRLGLGDPRVVCLGRDLVGGVLDSAVQERA